MNKPKSERKSTDLVYFDDRQVYTLDITKLPSQCLGCSRYHENQKCKAFPDGIPTSVFLNEISHNTPFPGDHDIQWQSKEPEWR